MEKYTEKQSQVISEQEEKRNINVYKSIIEYSSERIPDRFEEFNLDMSSRFELVPTYSSGK
jgi:hypothetical protein